MYLTTKSKHLTIAGITFAYSFAKASFLECYDEFPSFGWVIGKLVTWPLLYSGLGCIIDSIPTFNQVLSRRILVWYAGFLVAAFLYSEMHFGFSPLIWLKFPRLYFEPYGQNLRPCADYRWFILAVIATIFVGIVIRLRLSVKQQDQ